MKPVGLDMRHRKAILTDFADTSKAFDLGDLNRFSEFSVLFNVKHLRRLCK